MSGIVAPPTLNGVELRISGESTVVDATEAAHLRTTTAGRTVKQRLAWVGLDDYLLPTERTTHRVRIAYRNLGSEAERVRELLALPEPHTLSLWRPVTLGYPGDGSKVEGWLPWRSAEDVDALPIKPPAGTFDRKARIGFDGAPLTVELKDTAAYEAGTPSAGAIWFDTGGQRFKLNSAPTSAETVLITTYPLLRVVRSTEQSQTFRAATIGAEPRDLELQEI